MMGAVLLACISIAVGVYLLLGMKKQYLKEVYMLSFLN